MNFDQSKYIINFSDFTKLLEQQHLITNEKNNDV